VSTAQLKRAVEQRPPHPATVAQRREVPFGAVKRLPPHPATVVQQREGRWLLTPRGAEARAAQRMELVEQQEAQPTDFIKDNPQSGLVEFSEACLTFAKASDGTVQEVQAMWYRLSTDGPWALAVSANSAGHDRYAVNAIEAGILVATNIKGHGKKQAEKNAKALLASRSKKAIAVATTVTGKSHAEQNLLRWIAPQLTTTSAFYIYGTKNPCSQCRPRLARYQARLEGTGAQFFFKDQRGQDVEEDAVKEQVVANDLAIPG
jgi:hypothetical protein